MLESDDCRLLLAVELALQIGCKLHLGDLDPQNHEREVESELQKHKLPEDWSEKVRGLALMFQTYSVMLTEHIPIHKKNVRLKKARLANSP